MPIEREIPIDRVIDLKETMGPDEEGLEEFAITEDLVTTHIFSIISERKRCALEALNELWGTPIQIYIMKTREEIFAYITFNNVDVAFFFVGRYPNEDNHIEEAPSERERKAFERFCS